jgi:hypothetical protein
MRILCVNLKGANRFIHLFTRQGMNTWVAADELPVLGKLGWLTPRPGSTATKGRQCNCEE